MSNRKGWYKESQRHSLASKGVKTGQKSQKRLMYAPQAPQSKYTPEISEKERQEWMSEKLNPLDYADNPAELEVQKELYRTGTRNEPVPGKCPKCGSELDEGGGYVGETVLFCPEHGIVWEDSEDAIE